MKKPLVKQGEIALVSSGEVVETFESIREALIHAQENHLIEYEILTADTGLGELNEVMTTLEGLTVKMPTNLCDLGLIPYWRGSQADLTLDLAPFALELNDRGLIRLKHSDTTDYTVSAYASADYHFQTTPPGASSWGTILAHKSLDSVKELCGDLSGLDVLEIGGGTYYNAQFMVEELGASHVTLADPAVKEVPSDSISVWRDYFLADTDLKKRFEIIVSFNTLEHVPDPVGFLQAAHRHLLDGGRLVLKMPDCEEGFHLGDLGICVHEHLSYFTLDSLDALLKRCGFAREREVNYRGALQIVARKTSPQEKACASTDGLLRKFYCNSHQHVARLNHFGRDHKGEDIAFVGASAGLCTLLFLSGIADHASVTVYDSDEWKVDRFMPGVKTPIRSISDPTLRTHRHIFIVPINFYSEIYEQLRNQHKLQQTTILSAFAPPNNS